MNLTASQAKTLRTIAAGPVDCYSGTKGIDCRSLAALVRKGLLVNEGSTMANDTYVTYQRHSITAAGTAWIAAQDAPTVAPVAAPAKMVYLDDYGMPVDYDFNNNFNTRRAARFGR
jgi:hypothetical protein